MSHITQFLSRVETGDPRAANELLPLVYNELRKLATIRLSQEKSGQTLQATALVHEAYLRLLGPEGAGQPWHSRGHFFAAAAEAMRRLLVENARHKRSQRAGGSWERQDLSSCEIADRQSSVDVLVLNEALELLERQHPRKAALVKFRYFAGFTHLEAAEALGISSATADNDWAYAKSWLKLRLDSNSAHS